MSTSLQVRARLLSRIAVLACAVAPSVAWAQAQPDVRDVRPIVMMLVDTSGSMEYTTAASGALGEGPRCVVSTDPVSGASLPITCAGVTTSQAVGSTTVRSRWVTLLEAMTGSFPAGSNFDCACDRYRAFGTGQPDSYEPLGTTFLSGVNGTRTVQQQNGILDLYASRVSFGLMTFDNISGISTGATDADSLGPSVFYPSALWTAALSEGPRGDYSYGPDRFLTFPLCPTTYSVNGGVRRPATGSESFRGSLIEPAAEIDALTGLCPSGSNCDHTLVNAQIQEAILGNPANASMRPSGGTPTDAMLEDLKHFLSQTRFTVSDPYRACRPKYGILISDGRPSSPFRDRMNCQAVTGAGPDGTGCPYQVPQLTAAQLCDFGTVLGAPGPNGIYENGAGDDNTGCRLASAGTGSGFLNGLFVVAFQVSDTAALAALDQIAAAGGTGSAIQVSNVSDLLNRMQATLDRTAVGTTTRTASATGLGSTYLASGGTQIQYRISSGFRVAQWTGGGNGTPAVRSPWAGVLERQRTTCAYVASCPYCLTIPTPAACANTTAPIPCPQALDDATDRLQNILNTRTVARDIYTALPANCNGPTTSSTPPTSRPATTDGRLYGGPTSTASTASGTPIADAPNQPYAPTVALQFGNSNLPTSVGTVTATLPQTTGPNGTVTLAPDAVATSARLVKLNLSGTNFDTATPSVDYLATQTTGASNYSIDFANDNSNLSSIFNISGGNSTQRQTRLRAMFNWLHANSNTARGQTNARLGAIYHSSPVLIGPPRSDVADEAFNIFRNSYRGRPVVAYTSSTNDGLLHAFLIEDYVATAGNIFGVPVGTCNTTSNPGLCGGHELWAFAPPNTLRQLEDASINRRDLSDETPVVRDVRLRQRQSDGPSTVTYRTVLITGQRAGDGSYGGGGYIALDVTDPFHPLFLWQYTDMEIRQSFGRPAVTQVNFRIGNVSVAEDRAVAIFGGGNGQLDPNRQSGTTNDCPILDVPYGTSTTSTTAGPTALSPTMPALVSGGAPITGPGGTNTSRSRRKCWAANPTRGGRSVYIVDVSTGEPIRVWRNLPSPFPGGWAAFNGEVGATASRAFSVDQDGVVWRIDMADPDPQKWTLTPFHDLFWDGNSGTNGQPSYEAPVITSAANGQIAVLAATSDLDNLDNLAPHRVASITENRGVGSANILNWEVRLSGEMATGPMQLFEGNLYFSTFNNPPGSTNLCNYGFSRLWGVNATTNGGSIPSGFTASSAGTTYFPQYAMTQGTTATQYPFIDRIDQSNSASALQWGNQILMGVSVDQEITCVTGSQQGDSVYGTRFLPSATTGGRFRLVAQSSSRTPASLNASAPSVGTVVINLPQPASYTRFRSWAGTTDI